MSTIRTTLLSVLLLLVIGAGAYLAAVPLPALASQPAAASCPVTGTASFSAQELRAMLDARYLRRVGLPR